MGSLLLKPLQAILYPILVLSLKTRFLSLRFDCNLKCSNSIWTIKKSPCVDQHGTIDFIQFHLIDEWISLLLLLFHYSMLVSWIMLSLHFDLDTVFITWCWPRENIHKTRTKKKKNINTNNFKSKNGKKPVMKRCTARYDSRWTETF